MIYHRFTDLSRLSELLPLVRRHHDAVQVDSFITAKSGLTVWGCLRQALREIDTRIDGLLGALIDIETRRKRRNLATTGSELERVREQLALASAERSAQETANEFLRFYSQACAAADSLGPTTEADRERLDLEFWYVTLKSQAAEDMISTGRVKGSTVRHAACLPDPWRRRLLSELTPPNSDGLHRWLVEQTPVLFDVVPPAMTIDEVRRELVSESGLTLGTSFAQLVESMEAR